MFGNNNCATLFENKVDAIKLFDEFAIRLLNKLSKRKKDMQIAYIEDNENNQYLLGKINALAETEDDLLAAIKELSMKL